VCVCVCVCVRVRVCVCVYSLLERYMPFYDYLIILTD